MILWSARRTDRTTTGDLRRAEIALASLPVFGWGLFVLQKVNMGL